ncbi:histone-lysine N-methyltransferase PRDM16-like [Folsomia candida]|uniref:histone-lysine N-methyltransferase PRDM16-like n=1 Tax=Folsomia candida TaxID=158441 RepID=UPI001604E02C|nr:histone-lysine N-methyltransferase PRDM16-like [Folsomia candida]
METDPVVELSTEFNSLRDYLSKSRNRIGEIARRAGILIEPDEFYTNTNPGDIISKLVHFMDEILSLPWTTEALMFATFAAQGSFGHAFLPDGCDPLIDTLAELCSALPEITDSMELVADPISRPDQEHVDRFDPRNVTIMSLDFDGTNSLEIAPFQTVSQNVPNVNSSSEKIWECPTCPKTFQSKQNLNLHVETHDQNAKVQCEICGKILKNPACLYFHNRNMHTKRDRPRCQICGRTYFNTPALKKHVESVHSSTNRPRFPCGFPGCDKSYLRKGDCRSHGRIEYSENPVRFRCKVCLKVFKIRQHLD